MNQIIFEDMNEIFFRKIDWHRLYNKKILITGAYGMLASYAIYMLIYLNEYTDNPNIEIIAVGRDIKKARARFGEYFDKPYFRFIKSDFLDDSLQDVSPDYIIHAASPASSQYYGVNPVGVTIPNVIGTYKLMNIAKEKKVESFLYISSGEVYGKTSADTISENNIGFSDPLDIRYCYGESKRMAECLCNCFFYQYNVPVKIARLGHTYGPTMDIENDKRVFAEFVGNIVRGENIVIKSDGTPMRAFCYAADAIAAFYTIMLSGQNGEAYNIANMNGLISMRDLAVGLCEIYSNLGISAVFKQRKTNENYIESSQKKHNIPNTVKLKGLGWECKYDVFEGFQRTVKSFM